MKVDVRHEGNISIITPAGPMIIGAGERLMNETVGRLFADHRFKIVIDLGGVPRLDSSGVDSLVMAVRRARENGGDAKLANLMPRVRQLLEMTQLTTVFDIATDVADAVSRWTNPPASS